MGIVAMGWWLDLMILDLNESMKMHSAAHERCSDLTVWFAVGIDFLQKVKPLANVVEKHLCDVTCAQICLHDSGKKPFDLGNAPFRVHDPRGTDTRLCSRIS